MKVHNKLVRDLIPQIIVDSGRTPVCSTLSESEYQQELAKKLVEEAQEFAAGPCMEELADLLEVFEAICHSYGYDTNAINSIKASKKTARGGFEDRIYLKHVL